MVSHEPLGQMQPKWMRPTLPPVEYEDDGLPAYTPEQALTILHNYACANFNDSPHAADADARLNKCRDIVLDALHGIGGGE